MRAVRLGAATCFVLLVAACGGGTTTALPGTTAAVQPSAAPSAVQSVPESKLAFTGVTLKDQPFDGSSLAGKKAVLWFWAPWCPKCAREAKQMAVAQAAHGEQVTIVGIPAFGTVPEMKQFTTDFKVETVTHVADPEGKIWRRFLVTEQPAYAFIDDTGAIDLVRGEIGPERFNAKLEELIAK